MATRCEVRVKLVDVRRKGKYTPAEAEVKPALAKPRPRRRAAEKKSSMSSPRRVAAETRWIVAIDLRMICCGLICCGLLRMD